MNTTPITDAERLVDDLWRGVTVGIDLQTVSAAEAWENVANVLLDLTANADSFEAGVTYSDACFLALGLAALAGSGSIAREIALPFEHLHTESEAA